MNWLPGPETRAAVLKHPFVLAGVAVVALLAMTAGVLVLIDSARGSSADTPGVIVEPLTTATPGSRARTATAFGVRGTTLRTTAVRFGPGPGTSILGTLPRGTEVQIDGRTEENEWYRVIFPPNSELHGWVDAELLEVTGDPDSLVIATAEPFEVDVPTQPPSEITPVDEDGTPTPTSTPGGLPDLVVGTTPILSDGKLFVTVVNQGAGAATGDIVVAVFNSDGTALLGGATLPAYTLEAGQSIDIGTGLEVTESRTLLLVVDPNGDIEESENTNNQILVEIDLGEPESGDTPPPAPDL